MSVCSCSYSKLSAEEHFGKGINEGQGERLVPPPRSHNTFTNLLFIKHPARCGADKVGTKDKSPKKTKGEREK